MRNISFLGFQKQDIRLIWNLSKMSLRDRFLGSRLGLIWTVIHPMMLLGMYTFVFGFVFKTKLPGAETTLSYVIWLLIGFVPYLAIADSITNTGSAVISGASLIKNLVFKSEALPVAAVMVASIPFLVGMTFVMILLIVDGNYPSWHAAALPLVFAVQFGFFVGLGFFLSATCVFVRDIVQALPTVNLLIVFFTPIFYTLEMMPSVVRQVTFLNPFYHIAQFYRDILLDHALPNGYAAVYMGTLALILLVVGLKYFRRLKGYFEIAM